MPDQTMRFVTTDEVADKWGVESATLRLYASQCGAVKAGRTWVWPESALVSCPIIIRSVGRPRGSRNAPRET